MNDQMHRNAVLSAIDEVLADVVMDYELSSETLAEEILQTVEDLVDITYDHD